MLMHEIIDVLVVKVTATVIVAFPTRYNHPRIQPTIRRQFGSDNLQACNKYLCVDTYQ